MKSLNVSLRRDRLSKLSRAVLVPFLLAFVLLLTVLSTSQAMPREPIERTPVPRPYPIPANGFNWYAVPDFSSNWDEASQTYNDAVRATTFPINFDGCRTWADADSGTSALTYTWTIDGQATTTHQCFISRNLAQGPHTVSVLITGGTTPLGPFTQAVTVKDFLIVALGDSYGSGEGSPDVPQSFTYDWFGNPTAVAQPAVWESLRCHRSGNAPAAQAARQIESDDAHSTVTFMSFACSGATINRDYYADQSPIQPYRPNGDSAGVLLSGSGILGPYAGRVPPNPSNPEPDRLPSQVDQLLTALTRADGSMRQVDALILSAGGNDAGFGNVATLCLLFDNCQNYILFDNELPAPKTLTRRVQADMVDLPARYAALAQALQSIPMAPNGKVYITEYPDATRNDQGGSCSEMLTDIVPWWAEGSLVDYINQNGATQTPVTPFAMRGTDVQFAWSFSVWLNDRVHDAAANHGWVLVDGIAPQSGNLFSGHGYCASESWVRRALDSVNRQGPWTPGGTSPNPIASGDLLNTMLTTGTLHPTESGYAAIASRIYEKIRPNLLPTAP